ncbi:type IV pilus assembly protein PilM [Candidatus Kaiserbacteria bacterium]|nr:MAG: type IV pilus assembly protein PilM [Candidatus Kaiserbacteria bacterium]
MGILDKIRSSLTSSQKGRSGSVIGVDIGSSSIKVVQLRQEKGRAVLETYGEIALGPYAGTEVGRATHLQPSELAKALTDLMTEANVTATDSGVSVPFSASLTSVIEMPKMDQAQLEHMIPLEARKYIPANINEVMLDWFIIPDDPAQEEWSRSRSGDTQKAPEDSGKTEVLLVAIHNEILNNFQTITKEAGLNVGFYELEIFGAVRSSLSHGIAPVMVVDIGAATTKVYIVERGIIRFSHLINQGSQDLTLGISRALGWNFERSERAKREQGLVVREGVEQAQDKQVKEALLSTLGRIFSDVNRVLLSYEKKYGRNISRVVLAGGGASLYGLPEYAGELVSVDVERSNPFGRVQTPAFLEDVLVEVGPEFAVAVGMALRKMQG